MWAVRQIRLAGRYQTTNYDLGGWTPNKPWNASTTTLLVIGIIVDEAGGLSLVAPISHSLLLP